MGYDWDVVCRMLRINLSKKRFSMLKDFLLKQKPEAVNMEICEFVEKKYKEYIREESREEVRELEYQNTAREAARADAAELRASTAESRASAAESEIARLRAEIARLKM